MRATCVQKPVYQRVQSGCNSGSKLGVNKHSDKQ